MKKIVLVLLFIITYSFTNTLEDGKLAYDNNDYIKAFKNVNGNKKIHYVLKVLIPTQRHHPLRLLRALFLKTVLS